MATAKAASDGMSLMKLTHKKAYVTRAEEARKTLARDEVRDLDKSPIT